METRKILITDRFSPEAFLTLQQQSFLQTQKTNSPDISAMTAAELKGIHGLIIRSRTVIDEKFLAKAKDLQVIVTATSGFDHIDLDSAEKWGVTVMHTPWANVESAAQLTWGLVLACASKVVAGYKQVKAGEWQRELVTGTELSRKTYGVVGLGRIGSRVSEIAQAFGMNVIAYDPYVDEQKFIEQRVERVAYEEILKRSDVLSFHVPKTRETKYMLNRSHFDYIHRSVILINTSRGSAIHEQSLCEALDNKWIECCGLDVFEKEPLQRQSKLLQLPNVVFTPHCGANTTEAFAKASEEAALKILRFFMDSSTEDTLPPKAAWYGAAPAWESSEN